MTSAERSRHSASLLQSLFLNPSSESPCDRRHPQWRRFPGFLGLLVSGNPRLHGQSTADEALIVELDKTMCGGHRRDRDGGRRRHPAVRQRGRGGSPRPEGCGGDAAERGRAGRGAQGRDRRIAETHRNDRGGRADRSAGGARRRRRGKSGELQLQPGADNAAPLHAAGKIGQDVVVAVIDSGTANVSTRSRCWAAASSVARRSCRRVQDPLSATHRENGSHGTADGGNDRVARGPGVPEH